MANAIPGTSKMKYTTIITNGFKLKKCFVKIRKEILKSKLIRNRKGNTKIAKNGKVKQTIPKTPNNKKSTTNKIKNAKNTSRSKDTGVQVSKNLKSPRRSKNYDNLIFIRLPKITASDKTGTKDFKGKSPINKNKLTSSFKLITDKLRKKYGSKMFTSGIKLKRLKHASLDRYDKKRKIRNKKNNKSVSFIETVEIFGSENSNSSIQTSTPLNKKKNERESNNDSLEDSKSRLRKRKVALKQYEVQSKRPKRAVAKRVEYNEESQNFEINLDSSDDEYVIADDPLRTENVDNKNRQEPKKKIIRISRTRQNSREKNTSTKDDTEIVNGKKEKNREKKKQNEEENSNSSVNKSDDSNDCGTSKQSQEKEDITRKNVLRSTPPHTLKESENSILKAIDKDTMPKKRDQSNRKNAEKNTSVVTESSSNSSKQIKLDEKSVENSRENFEDAMSSLEENNAIVSSTEHIIKHRLSCEQNIDLKCSSNDDNEKRKKEDKTKLSEEENEEVLSATQISRNIHGRKTYRSENNLTPYSDISDRITPSLEQDNNEAIKSDRTHESSKIKNKIFSDGTPIKDIERSESETPKKLGKSSKSGIRKSTEDEIITEKNFDNNEIKDNDGKDEKITELVTNENKSVVDYDNIVQNPTETPPDFLVMGEGSILTDDEDDNLPISNFAKSRVIVTEPIIHNVDSNSSNSSEIKNSAPISDDLFDIVKRSEAPKETHLVSKETVGNVFGTAAGAFKTIDTELSHTDKHFIDDDFSDQFVTPEPFDDIMNDEHLHFSNTNDNDIVAATTNKQNDSSIGAGECGSENKNRFSTNTNFNVFNKT